MTYPQHDPNPYERGYYPPPAEPFSGYPDGYDPALSEGYPGPQPVVQPGSYATAYPRPSTTDPYLMNYRMPRKRHSIAAHVVLFIFTGGIGNVLYWLWIESENNKRGY